MLATGVLLGATSKSLVAAAPKHTVLTKLDNGASIDWSAGVLRVHVVTPANRHAPSPTVARAGSRRRAEEAARATLATMIAKVPGAPTLSTAASTALTAAATVDESSLDIAPDGAVALDLLLPLARLLGDAATRDITLATDDRDAVTAIIVDAHKLPIQPTLGISLSGTPVTMPTLWIANDAALTDELIGAHPVRVTATRNDGASLTVDADVTAALAHGALLILRVGSHS